MGAGSVIVNQPGVYFVDADGNLATADDGTTIASHEGLIVAGKDGTVMRFMRVASDGTLRIDPTGTTTQPVSAASLPLPTGAATEATVATLATEAKLEAVRVLLASLDSKDYATETTQATLATETKLEAVRVLLASLDGKDYATQTTLASILVDTGQIEALLTTIDADTSNLDVALSTRATEATLAAADTKLGTIDGVLDSIKDTDGIKKITDELPAGTQEIGSVAQGTKAADSAGWPFKIVDAAGNLISNILNNAIRRLETRSSITSPDGSLDAAVVTDNSINRLESRSSLVGQLSTGGGEVKATMIADTEDAAEKRIQVEARNAPGFTVQLGTGIPADPAALEIGFMVESGGGGPDGEQDMLVNGSGTPAAFEFTPDTGKVLAVQQLLVVFAADDFDFDGASFGPNARLTNGIKFETDIGGIITEIFNIRQNEDFIRVPGRIPLVNNTGPKDLLGVAFAFGGLLKLDEAAGDKLIATIRDNLTSVKFQYLTATVYGAEE